MAQVQFTYQINMVTKAGLLIGGVDALCGDVI